MKVLSMALCAGLVAASFATIPRADATTVKQFDLPRMTSSAARVFRGTVTDVRAGTKKVGGGEIATTIYRIKVTEAFKGEFATFKNITYADVEMLGSIKAEKPVKGVQHFSIFRDMPKLERGQDYLMTARAKGLMDKFVRRRHAVPNALLPTVTLIFIQLGFVVGGAVTVETVYSWPGLGLLLYQALADHDGALLQGLLLVLAGAVLVMNLIGDLLLHVIDPRVRAA